MSDWQQGESAAKYDGPVPVIAFMRYYLPGYKAGGPIRTVANMASRLEGQIQFFIVTSDRDLHDHSSYPRIKVDAWNEVGAARVFYASTKGQRFAALSRLLQTLPYGVLYLNSLFDPIFTAKPLLLNCFGRLKRPVVIAPRGELSKGALNLKAWKKRLYLLFFSRGVKQLDLIWQASSSSEKSDIQRALPGPLGDIHVAPDLAPPTIQTSSAPPQRTGPLRIVFLSRISPMKNLEFVLEVLAQFSMPVDLSIYGAIDDWAYWARCQTLVDVLPSWVRVDYRGPIPHDKVSEVLSQNDLFFLPSRGENYGHAIVEALASGLPVLISDRTRWRGLAAEGIGWDLPLEDRDAYIAAIRTAALATTMDRRRQAVRCRIYAQTIASDICTLASNVALFRSAMCARKNPSVRGVEFDHPSKPSGGQHGVPPRGANSARRDNRA